MVCPPPAHDKYILRMLGKLRGFAFAAFTAKADAERAVALGNGQVGPSTLNLSCLLPGAFQSPNVHCWPSRKGASLERHCRARQLSKYMSMLSQGLPNIEGHVSMVCVAVCCAKVASGLLHNVRA